MSNGENFFAGALFFSLMTFGAFIKIGGLEGLAVGAGFAFLAGFFIRRAFVQIAENGEDDYYRLETQINELKKSNEKSREIPPAEISTLIDKNLQDVEKHLAALENISETDAAIGATVKKIEDNTSAIYFALKALSDFIPAEMQKIHAAEELNRQTIATATNILQTLDTLLKNPDFQKEISELAQVNAEIFSQNKNLLDAVNTLKSINENLLKTTENLRAVFEDIENLNDDN